MNELTNRQLETLENYLLEQTLLIGKTTIPILAKWMQITMKQ